MTRAIVLRSLPVVLASVIVAGCSAGGPTGPDSPLASTAQAPVRLWGMVVDATGACVADAIVEVVAGQHAGQRVTQTTPCGVWDEDGGFVFDDLTAGVGMLLRASAAGWRTDEKAVTPHAGAQQAVFLTLSGV